MDNLEPNRRKWSLPTFRELVEMAGSDLLRNAENGGPSIKQGTRSDGNVGLLEAPAAICTQYGFDVLLVDLSIIRSRDFAQVLDSPVAASHVLCLFDDENNSVIRSYNDALLFLAKGTQPAGNDPIIAHPQLYGKSCVAVMIEDTRLLDTGRKHLLPCRSATSFQWLYKKGKARSEITVQAKRLASKFLDGLNENSVPFEIREKYNNSVLLIIPFMRPDVDPTISGSQRNVVKSGDHSRVPDPSGGLFLIVKACLLYTSPSPRDATLSRMPSSA